jgi:hypoxanthine-DNA glycosylase
LSREDKNWELLQNVLSSEASGREPRLFSSRRTLFGIPSALDAELAKISAESTAACGSVRDGAQACDDGDLASTARREGSASACKRGAAGHLLKNESRAGEKVAHHVEHNIDPVFDANSRVLILGTMPSPKSREAGFYYAHPQNRFWPALARVFDESVPVGSEERRAFAQAHGIALWDILASCTIEGASDATIAECVPNDIAWLCARAPIRAAFCTGNKAFELYGRYCANLVELPVFKLPSPSAANAATSLEKLTTAYRVILEYL